MRIVIATPFYPPEPGILATYAAGLEGALKDRGHDVIVVVFDKRLPPVIRHIVYLARMLGAISGASFVISLDTWSVGIPTMIAARVRGVPMMLRIGGDYLWEQYIARTGADILISGFYEQKPRFSFFERVIYTCNLSLLRSAHHVFFNTLFQKDIWDAAYHIPPSRSSVLENFYPEKRPSATAEQKVFVSANRGARYKNVARLEAAFASVKSRHPDITLDTRMVPHDEQLARLASSYAAVIPSISEIGSNIAIESVSFGRPFITTSDTGTKERLAECGIYIDTRSTEALEAAIEQLLDPAVYEKLARAAREFSFTHAWDQIAGEILQKMSRV